MLTESDIADRGFHELANFDKEWTLYTRPDASSGAWLGLHLRMWNSPAIQRRKVSFWLKWNGERFSKNPSSEALEKHYPEMFKVVTELLSELPVFVVRKIYSC